MKTFIVISVFLLIVLIKVPYFLKMIYIKNLLFLEAYFL